MAPAPCVIELLSAQGCLPEYRLPSWLGPSMDSGSTLTSLCPVTAPQVSDRPPGCPCLAPASPSDITVPVTPARVAGQRGQGCYWARGGRPRRHDPHADPRRKHAQRACEEAGGLHLLAPQNQVSGWARRGVRGGGPADTFAHHTFCPALPGTRTCRGSPSADSPRRGKLGEKTTRL